MEDDVFQRVVGIRRSSIPKCVEPPCDVRFPLQLRQRTDFWIGDMKKIDERRDVSAVVRDCRVRQRHATCREVSLKGFVAEISHPMTRKCAVEPHA